MAEEIQNTDINTEGLAALGSIGGEAPAVVEIVAPVEPKIDSFGRSYATGRRKDAAARVWAFRSS